MDKHEAAARLGVTAKTMQNARGSDALPYPASPFGAPLRWRRADVERYAALREFFPGWTRTTGRALFRQPPPIMPAEQLAAYAALLTPDAREAREAFERESFAMLEQLDDSSTLDDAMSVLVCAPDVLRLDAYHAIRRRAPSAGYPAEALLQAWSMTDVIGFCAHPKWTPVERLECFRYGFLREREGLRPTLAALPRTGAVALYRGTTDGLDVGRARSWTLREDVAEFFRGRRGRYRQPGAGKLLRLTLPAPVVHEHALFFDDGRQEAEVYFADDPRGLVGTDAEVIGGASAGVDLGAEVAA